MAQDASIIKINALKDACHECLEADDQNSIQRLKAELDEEKAQMEKMTHSRSNTAQQMARLQMDYIHALDALISQQHSAEDLALASEYVIDFCIYTMRLALYLYYQEKEDEK